VFRHPIDRVFEIPAPLTQEQIERQTEIYQIFLRFASLLDATIFHNEDSDACFELLRQARDKALSASRLNRSTVTMDVVSRLFWHVEKQDLLVGRVYFNAIDYADVRKFGRGQLDIENRAVMLRKGIQGTLFGAQVRTSRRIPPGYALLVPMDDREESFEKDPDFDSEKGPEEKDLIQIR